MAYSVLGFCLIFLFLGLYYLVKFSRFSSVSFSSRHLLSDPEQVLYFRLREALPDNFVLLSQVAFSSFITTKGGTDAARLSLFASARQKVADFVICSKSFTVLVVIELDDKTHNSKKDAARDLILKQAGITTLRYNVKNIPSVSELMQILL